MSKKKNTAPEKPVKLPKVVNVKVKPVEGKTKTITATTPKTLSQNGINKPWPSESGRSKETCLVWQICDELAAKNKANTPRFQKAKPPTRQEVLEATKKAGVKYSTFSNTFYRWRKFYGQFGRIKLDGTPAKPGGGRPRADGKPIVATKPPVPAKPSKPAPKAKKPAISGKPPIKKPDTQVPLPGFEAPTPAVV